MDGWFTKLMNPQGETLAQINARKKKSNGPVYRTVKVKKAGPLDFENGRRNVAGVLEENVGLRNDYLREQREKQGKPPRKGPFGRAWEKMTSS